jgi:tRNA-splicing ligase RtcB
MAAWCSFSEAARAEQNAREAAVLVVEPRAQPEAYRRSPLSVIGEHEESTIAQMRNCMAVGNVLAGVICADGHLG